MTVFIGYMLIRLFFNRGLFVMITYVWHVFLFAPFVNSSEILKKEEQ